MDSLELQYLAYTTLLTGTLWVPAIINRITEQGLWNALKHPQAEMAPSSLWGKRAVRAHMNAIENLVIFAYSRFQSSERCYSLGAGSFR